ncbi:DinB family protein [Oscillatoria amoena NRMC-F 0135]|nr:DinB family protein [Oscillatoria amoena NRMC-F 0135]
MEKDFLASLIKLFDRELTTLEKEISLYTTEETIWTINGEIKNTAGNLCLHLCGNLQHFIGTVLGHTGYVRNRDHEFAARNIAREQLLREIQTTKEVVKTTLSKLDPAILQQEYPLQVLGYTMTNSYFLVHLYGHLNYHLGQINYHRRLITR